MKHTTTGLLEALRGTLDVEAFLKNVREFDLVTQKQCLLKARKELLKPKVAALHGPEQTKTALSDICAAIEKPTLAPDVEVAEVASHN